MGKYTAIDDPSAYFQTKLYTGTGSELVITNDGNSDLQPDFLWIKNRTDGSTNHHAHNTNIGTTKTLFVNKVDQQETQAQSVKSVQSDGFTLGTWDGNNASAKNFVAWQWKANGGTTSSNTDGTIASTVQVNQDAGFSMLHYQMGTGNDTVGHGLGVAPEVVIWKPRFRDGTNGFWSVYTTLIDGSYDYLKLNDTTAKANSSLAAPTSTVFTGAGSSTTDYQYYMAWCFVSKQGYSKFGKYTGNGNVNGAFIYTGFKPAWVMVKQSNTARSWQIFDNKRDGYNKDYMPRLQADNTSAEAASAGASMDFISNGFKIRTDQTGANQSGGTYVYMAFAENPFVTSTGIMGTAR